MDFKNYNTLQDGVVKRSPLPQPSSLSSSSSSSNSIPISDQELMKNKKGMPRSLGILLTALSGIAVYSTQRLSGATINDKPTNVAADVSAIGIRTGTNTNMNMNMNMNMNSIIEEADRVVIGDDWSTKDKKNLIFVGHYPAPDIDSVGAAIGAAELYEGTPSIPRHKFNKESLWVLDRFGVTDKPKLVTDLIQEREEKEEDYEIVLVDHNDNSQIDPDINHKKIAGIIDHHGVNNFSKHVRNKPLLLLIEPWGSACSIVAALFQVNGKTPTKSTAGCLLSGILSDTLKLTGPTTAKQDHAAVSYLSKIALKDPDSDSPWNQSKAVDDLFLSQIQAKSNMTEMKDIDIITSDIKKYNCGDDGIEFAWGTIEGSDPFYSEYIEYPRICEWRTEIQQYNDENNLKYTFISFVEVLKHESVVMTIGDDAGKLLRKAFPESIPLFKEDSTTTPLCEGMTILKTKGLVSRKLQFQPAILRECSNFN